jgi:pimeloyl-ACP methyl ester carboxylesterase
MASRVLYLHGLGSGPSSYKAGFFRARFAEMGVLLEQPSLSVPSLGEMTVSSQLAVVEKLLPEGESATLIGSSMGGYVAALFAEKFPGRVGRQVLLAPAFGFPGRWFQRLPEEQAEAWKSTGFRTVWDYENGREDAIGYAFAEDGFGYRDFPEALVPTLILHGRKDDVVPLEYSEDYVAENPEVRLVAYGADHSLGEVLEPMWQEVSAFLGLTPGGGGAR